MSSRPNEQQAIGNSTAADTKARWRALTLIPMVIVFGLACKQYQGPGFDLINNFGPASVAYVVLLTLLLFVASPNPQRIIHIAVAAFAITCAIEFMQLWQPMWLMGIRKTLPGRLILGTTFSWLDFPAYVFGAIVSVVILKAISRPHQA